MDEQELPRYRCHKEVWAVKIKAIKNNPEEGWQIIPADEGYPAIHVPYSYMEKHNPVPGGYYVVYEDGYESWSPAEAFEAGYTRID